MTDTSASGSDFRSEVRDGLAEEWGDVYAKCVEETQTPVEGSTNPFADNFVKEDDSTPDVATDTERLDCKDKADTLLP